MKTILIGSGNTTPIVPPTLNDGSAEALSAWADYEYICTIRNMRAGGYTLVVVEGSDVQTLQSDMSTALSSTLAAIDSLYA